MVLSCLILRPRSPSTPSRTRVWPAECTSASSPLAARYASPYISWAIETESFQLPNFPYNPIAAERIKGWDVLHQYIWPPANLSTIVKESFENATETMSPIASDKANSISSVASSISLAASSVAARVASATISVTSSIFAKAGGTASQITPDFMLFLGDFIYSDIPNWGGGSLERYHQLYKRVYASPSFRKVYEKLRKSTVL